MKLNELSKYRTVRDRAEAVVRLLEGLPGKTLHDDKGHCTEKLLKALPRHLSMERSSNQRMSPAGLGPFLHKMEDAGWIMLEVNGKRTYNIFLVGLPDDWDEYSEPMKIPGNPVEVPRMTHTPELPQAVAGKLHPQRAVTTDEMRKIVKEEMREALSEWWSTLT